MRTTEHKPVSAGAIGPARQLFKKLLTHPLTPWVLAGLAGVLAAHAFAPTNHPLSTLCYTTPLFVGLRLFLHQQTMRPSRPNQTKFAAQTQGLLGCYLLGGLTGLVGSGLEGGWVSATAHVYGHMPLWAAYGVRWLGYASLQGLEWGLLLGVGFWVFRHQPALCWVGLPLLSAAGQWFLPRLLDYSYGQALTAFPNLLQAAEVLGVSTSTADNDWAYAKGWLRVEMGG